MKRSLARFAPALALWLAAASGAHANPNYTYDFNIRQIDVRLNSREGGGYVAVTSTPKVSGITAGTIPVVALNWLPVVNPSAYGVTQHLDATQNGGIFQITLSLTDDTTGKQKTLTFDGLLTGSFKITQDAGLGLHPDAEFVGGGSGGNPLKNPVQTATVGDYDFTVDLSHYVLPPNPLNPTPATTTCTITNARAMAKYAWRMFFCSVAAPNAPRKEAMKTRAPMMITRTGSAEGRRTSPRG